MHALLRNVAKETLQTFCLPGQFVWRLPRSSSAIALTFDDGPHPVHTAEVLDVLAAAGARATFFLLGQAVEQRPALAREIVAAGHAVGAHSFDHQVMPKQSAAELERDLERCRQTIAAATGVDTWLFRPPRGEVSMASIRSVCASGYRLVHWSKTFGDYRETDAVALERRIDGARVRAGDILLFHDHNPCTVRVLKTVLPRWVAAGMTFATLADHPRGAATAVNRYKA